MSVKKAIDKFKLNAFFPLDQATDNDYAYGYTGGRLAIVGSPTHRNGFIIPSEYTQSILFSGNGQYLSHIINKPYIDVISLVLVGAIGTAFIENTIEIGNLVQIKINNANVDISIDGNTVSSGHTETDTDGDIIIINYSNSVGCTVFINGVSIVTNTTTTTDNTSHSVIVGRDMVLAYYGFIIGRNLTQLEIDSLKGKQSFILPYFETAMSKDYQYHHDIAASNRLIDRNKGYVGTSYTIENDTQQVIENRDALAFHINDVGANSMLISPSINNLSELSFSFNVYLPNPAQTLLFRMRSTTSVYYFEMEINPTTNQITVDAGTTNAIIPFTGTRLNIVMTLASDFITYQLYVNNVKTDIVRGGTPNGLYNQFNFDNINAVADKVYISDIMVHSSILSSNDIDELYNSYINASKALPTSYTLTSFYNSFNPIVFFAMKETVMNMYAVGSSVIDQELIDYTANLHDFEGGFLTYDNDSGFLVSNSDSEQVEADGVFDDPTEFTLVFSFVFKEGDGRIIDMGVGFLVNISDSRLKINGNFDTCIMPKQLEVGRRYDVVIIAKNNDSIMLTVNGNREAIVDTTDTTINLDSTYKLFGQGFVSPIGNIGVFPFAFSDSIFELLGNLFKYRENPEKFIENNSPMAQYIHASTSFYTMFLPLVSGQIQSLGSVNESSTETITSDRMIGRPIHGYPSTYFNGYDSTPLSTVFSATAYTFSISFSYFSVGTTNSPIVTPTNTTNTKLWELSISPDNELHFILNGVTYSTPVEPYKDYKFTINIMETNDNEIILYLNDVSFSAFYDAFALLSGNKYYIGSNETKTSIFHGVISNLIIDTESTEEDRTPFFEAFPIPNNTFEISGETSVNNVVYPINLRVYNRDNGELTTTATSDPNYTFELEDNIEGYDVLGFTDAPTFIEPQIEGSFRREDLE